MSNTAKVLLKLRTLDHALPPLHRMSRALGLLRCAGEMNDAAEVLLTLYNCVRAAAGEAELDAVFGLAMREYVNCSACGLDTHAYSYTQYLATVPVGRRGGGSVCGVGGWVDGGEGGL